MTATDVDGGLGHFGEVVVFTNTSKARCSLRAYPGVAGLTSSGAQAAQARRVATGYLFQVHSATRVRLAPGAKASAGVETDDPAKQGDACTHMVALLVTPPNETHSVKATVNAGCAQPGLQVHPVVSGATGKD